MKIDPIRRLDEQLAQLDRNFPKDSTRIKANAVLSLKLQGVLPITGEDASYLEWMRREDPERYREIELLAKFSQEDEVNRRIAAGLRDQLLSTEADRRLLEQIKKTDQSRYQHILDCSTPPPREQCSRLYPLGHAALAILVGGVLSGFYEEAPWVGIFILPASLWAVMSLNIGLFYSQEKINDIFNAQD